MQMFSKDIERCIDACLSCYKMCLGMAMTHCLEKGGDHVKPPHFRAMIACADTCRDAAEMMLIHSPQAKEMCALCALACETCARECDPLPDMKECADECRRCAEECRKMSGIKKAA